MEIVGVDLISEEVRRKRWCWIGYVLRKEVNNDCVIVFGWKLEGKRSRGRFKIIWCYIVEKERDR